MLLATVHAVSGIFNENLHEWQIIILHTKWGWEYASFRNWKFQSVAMYFSSWRGLLIYIIAWSFSKKTYLYNFEDNYVIINARMFLCLTKYYSQSWWCLCMFVTTLVLVLLYLINQNILLCNLWLKCLTEDFVGYLWNLQCISCLLEKWRTNFTLWPLTVTSI